MPRPRRRSFIKTSGAAAVAGITGLAGCSGGNGNGTQSGTTGTGGSGSDTYTIASTLPETGAFSPLYQDLKRGYEMGVARVNANGGVHGKEVELIVKDDESDPRVLREKLTQMISNNDVDMIWGSFGGVLVTSMVAIAEREQIPLISVTFGETKLPEERGYEWSCFPFPNSRQHAESTTAVLQMIPEDERPTRIGQWVPNTNWSIEQANYWEQALTDAGFEMVFREKHQLHASDFSSLISKSESAGVEALLGTPAPDGGITAMKQINESTFTPSYIQFVRAADTSGWWNALGEAGRDVIMAPGWVPGQTGNGTEELLQTYYERYDVPKDDLPAVMTGASYNLTQVFEQA
ncbi:ABC transporter substrate-binding protein, partial [Halobacterium sp. KA-4]|uniref:substrate-binding domain-containing protein n=1 Tax=Halobacterium sp. KA-4 TaxID=2896367 RepID=UPI001E636991